MVPWFVGPSGKKLARSERAYDNVSWTCTGGGDPVGISRKTKKERKNKQEKKRVRGRQEVSEIRKHRLLRQQYRICPVTSSNMCVQPLQLV